MNALKHIAFATLVAFLPVSAGIGCSATPDASEQATGGASLAVVGASGTKNVDIAAGDVNKVLANEGEFTVDGQKTRDFGRILSMKTSTEFQAGGKTRRLIRDGNLLRLEGSTNNVAIEVQADKFTIVSDAGRWDCLLKGLNTSDRDKLAGAMTLGILAAFDEDLAKNAADVEEGRCEAVCVVAVAIVVGVVILASLAAFVVCETSGTKICLDAAKSKGTCTGKGGVKKVEKHCDIMSLVTELTGGRSKFKSSCTITCNSN